MPQHRAIATAINAAILGAGVAGQVSVARDNANPDSWHLFNNQIGGVMVAMIGGAVIAELITIGGHKSDEPPRSAAQRTNGSPSIASEAAPALVRPNARALDCSTVVAVLGRTTDADRARLVLEPAIAACLVSGTVSQPDRGE